MVKDYWYSKEIIRNRAFITGDSSHYTSWMLAHEEGLNLFRSLDMKVKDFSMSYLRISYMRKNLHHNVDGTSIQFCLEGRESQMKRECYIFIFMFKFIIFCLDNDSL